MIPVMRPFLGAEEAEAAAAAVRSGWLAQGPRVAEFEAAVALRVGAREGVAVSSCTAALHLALVLLGLGAGDEVIVPSLSFIATANAVVHSGARPVFADVDPLTLNLTPAAVSRMLTDHTRAVMVVHQGGCPADLDGLRAVCGAAGVAIVEDAACALGSLYKGRPIGEDAELAAFSFHPRKVITTGEGGMLVARDRELARRARKLREHGMSASAASRHASDGVVLEDYEEVGFNYRMTDVQAAVGLVQLQRLGAIVARRRELADRYRSLLCDVEGLTMATDPPYGKSNFQSFWVMLPNEFPLSRNDLLDRLRQSGVSARRGIMAAHVEPAYADQRAAELPVTEEITARSLILPMFHDMTEEEQCQVIDVIRKEAGLATLL